MRLIYRLSLTGLKLNFTATWGDPHYLGLTGLEIVGKDGEALPLSLSMLDADPRDLHTLPGYETDDRTLDKWVTREIVRFSLRHTLVKDVVFE